MLSMKKFLSGITAAAILCGLVGGGHSAFAQSAPAVNAAMGCSSGQVLGNVSSAVGCITPVVGATQALSAKAVPINTTGDQATIAVPSYITKYSITSMVVTNCTGTPILAQLALWTGAGGTGTNVSAAATITGASSATAIVNPTVTAANTALTASSLFVRVAVANVAALTCDVYVILNNLS